MLSRPLLQQSRIFARCLPLHLTRLARYQAYESSFDRDELSEARAWYETFDQSRLPKGATSYSRSSGPGGQHVNKSVAWSMFAKRCLTFSRTESKATTVWPAKDLTAALPKLLRSSIRSSRYYTAGNDSWTIHAQTHRSKDANTDENHRKMAEEVERLYKKTVPGETSEAKREKHKQM